MAICNKIDEPLAHDRVSVHEIFSECVREINIRGQKRLAKLHVRESCAIAESEFLPLPLHTFVPLARVERKTDGAVSAPLVNCRLNKQRIYSCLSF